MQRIAVHRLVFRATLLLICAFVVIAITMERLGTQRSPSPAMLAIDPGSCSQPCWHDIQIGKTTVKQAEALLKQDSKFVVELNIDPNSFGAGGMSWEAQSGPIDWGAADPQIPNDPNSPVNFLYMYLDDLRLGDAIQVFGEPVGYELCWRTDTMDAHVHFNNHIDVLVSGIYIDMMGHMSAFAPNQNVAAVIYHPLDQQPYRRELRPWEGFKAPSKDGWKCRE